MASTEIDRGRGLPGIARTAAWQAHRRTSDRHGPEVTDAPDRSTVRGNSASPADSQASRKGAGRGGRVALSLGGTRCQALHGGLPGAPGRQIPMPLQGSSLLPLASARSGGVLPRAAAAPFSTDARLFALHRHGRRYHGSRLAPKTTCCASFDRCSV
jgi:hypothetical protein